MGETIQLSEKVLDICAENLDGPRGTCDGGNCPIRKACLKQAGSGREALNKWAAQVNDSAISICK